MKSSLLCIFSILLLVSCNKGLSKADKEKTHAFLNSFIGWSQTLTKRGHAVGVLIGKKSKGEPVTAKELEQKLADFNKVVKDKLEEVKAIKLPDFKELNDFKKMTIEYLEFELKAVPVFKEVFNKIVPNDPNSFKKAMSGAMELNKKETEYKLKIDNQTKLIYKKLNE